MSFDSFNLCPPLLTAISELGYEQPTPIQSQAIPVVLEGRDVMGLAQTGTGKTAAFMLPILEKLKDKPLGKPLVLVIAPTRELAEQIHDATLDFCRHLKMRTVTIYGGVSIRPQTEKLRRGVDIIICCPGRLLDHLQQRTVDLSGIETLVLDEADQMFDMGFLPNIRQILRNLPAKRQNLLFSATMPSDIRRLAEEILVDPVRVEIGRAAPAQTVAHAMYPVEPHLKTSLLKTLLSQTATESVLVFTRTKHRAKKLALMVEKFGYKTASLQGNLSQNRRQDALDGFRSGKYQVLVATDIAARGIDVSSVSHVINYDIPETVEAYTHRIGRTGRAAKTGDAFTFISREDDWKVRNIEKILGKRIERRTIEGFDYSARPAEASAEFARGPRPQRGGGQRSERGFGRNRPSASDRGYGKSRPAASQRGGNRNAGANSLRASY